MKKRALERHLRHARRCFITIFKEDTAQNLHLHFVQETEGCMLTNHRVATSQDCPTQHDKLDAHFRGQQSTQPNSQAAREFLVHLATAPEGAYTVYSHLNEEDLYAKLIKSNLRSAAEPDGICFFLYKQFEDVFVPAMTAICSACSLHQ